MKDIAIYAAGGFGREVACQLNLINQHEPTWNLVGFIDDTPAYKGKQIDHFGPCFGGADVLNHWNKPLSVVIAVGSPSGIKSIVSKINNPLIDFPNIISPTVTFLDSSNVNMGKGNILCTNCMVSSNVTIGNFNIFNGYIPIGHDAVIGDCNVFMPSVNISGGVKIGDCNFMGVQSVVLQYLEIGNQVRVGANSVIMRNTKDGALYVGNPAKKMEL